SHADFSQNSVGQAVSFQSFPGHAVVVRAIQTAPGAAARKKPRLPAGLPKRRKNNVWIVRIEHDVDATGVFIFAYNIRPRLAAVGRAKNAPLFVRAEGMSKRRDQHHVFVSWIDNQRADLPAVL